MSQYVNEYRELAKLGGNFRGLSLLQHQKRITQIIAGYKQGTIKSLLDYGAGAGDAYKAPHFVHHPWGVKHANVYLYDPAFRKRDVLPAAGRLFDGVICSDVLEHVPEAEVDELVRRLFQHARHFVFASVCCRPAKKFFKDGTNMHVTQRPFDWWRHVFETHWESRERPDLGFTLVETP